MATKLRSYLVPGIPVKGTLFMGGKGAAAEYTVLAVNPAPAATDKRAAPPKATRGITARGSAETKTREKDRNIFSADGLWKTHEIPGFVGGGGPRRTRSEGKFRLKNLKFSGTGPRPGKIPKKKRLCSGMATLRGKLGLQF